MSDPKPPRKGQFQPGNKMGKGRPKGCENKFGPNLREKLLAGIAASGEKKAKKAGINSKIDGTAYFVETLPENPAAASALFAKLIPKETPPIEAPRPPAIVNVISVLEGNMWPPGKTMLLPYEECHEAHQAYRAGAEAWQVFLEKMKPHLLLREFEKLSSVPVPERKTLQLDEQPRLIGHAPPEEPQLSAEARLLAELDNLTDKQLMDRALYVQVL